MKKALPLILPNCGLFRRPRSRRRPDRWDFDLKKGRKIVGQVRRVVSADGKALTVHNTGVQPSGATGDETLVFDRQ